MAKSTKNSGADLSVIGVDIGKDVFDLVAFGEESADQDFQQYRPLSAVACSVITSFAASGIRQGDECSFNALHPEPPGRDAEP